MSDDTLSPGAKILRSLGLTVLFMTVVGTLSLAYTYLTGTQFSGWQRLAVAGSLLFAAVSAVAMSADLFDYWRRGRRFSPFTVRMLRSLVFVAMLAAFILSVVAKGPAVLVFLAPALFVYLMAVWRAALAEDEAVVAGRRRTAAAPARRRPGGGGQSGPRRQRRGGRKRK